MKVQKDYAVLLHNHLNLCRTKKFSLFLDIFNNDKFIYVPKISFFIVISYTEDEINEYI